MRQRAEYHKQYRQRRREAGQCVRCGKPRSGASLCHSCLDDAARRLAQRNRHLAAIGKCRQCAGAANGQQLCNTCRKRSRANDVARRKRFDASGQCTRCGHHKEDQSLAWCRQCRVRQTKHNRTERINTRQAAITAYGGQCVCCGEADWHFLTIDHIDGGGAEHRRRLNKSGGLPFYRWLQKNAWPAEFQALCWNCNLAKHQFGSCPHVPTSL